MKIDIVFAEFNGGSGFTPPVDNISKYFPDADIKVFTNKDCEDVFNRALPFWGYHMNDYWKVRKLLESKADIAISFDADIRIVSENVVALLQLSKRFGVCLPANPRKLVKIDTETGSHSDGELDDTLGMGYAMNMTPIAFDTGNARAREMLTNYCNIMKKDPVRGPLAMWRAAYRTGLFPCLLPPQWCVCAEDVGIGNEIILHVGHEKVRKHYVKF